MTPKEKAQDFINKFGKDLASKVVDEIQVIKSVYHDEELYDYYEQVKHELNKQQEQ
jgi:hypothetical protein